MEKIQVESSIQLIRLWKRYRPSSFFTLMMKKLHFSLENKCKLSYYTVNALIWKSNSLRFSLERYCLVENIVKLENENHHGVAIAIM